MTDEQIKKKLVTLVKPWLKKATVDTFQYEESCDCYSEWTQEPPRFEVTFKAPWEKTEKELSLLVVDIEEAVREWAEENLSFLGCGCCGGHVSYWVRVIPELSKRLYPSSPYK